MENLDKVPNHLASTLFTGTFLNDAIPQTSDWHTALNYAIALMISFGTNALVTFARDCISDYRSDCAKRRMRSSNKLNSKSKKL